VIVAVLLMELSIVSLLLGWVWVVVANGTWPAPWAVLLAAPMALIGGRKVPYAWRRLSWFDGLWWAIVAIVVALLAEAGNALAAGPSSGARWNVQFVAGLLLAWRGWVLAEGWIDRDMVESEFQVGTVVVLLILVVLVWIVPGAGLLSAVVFAASGMLGLGLARRAERRDPRASLESDWLALVGGLIALIVAVAVVVVALVTPDVLLALFEQAQTAALAALAGLAAVFAWLGSFFPGMGAAPDQTPPAGPVGPIVAATPQAPRGDMPTPPFWVFELLLTFVGVVFLVVAGRAIYRLMKTNVRPFSLGLARQRDPALPVSTPDGFSWSGWWKALLARFRTWLAGTRTPTGRSERGSRRDAPEVAEQRSIRALYRELLTTAARAGFERQPSTTPNELAREVNAARPAASPSISTVTELYVRARYGEEPVGRDELSRMRNAVQQARRQLTPPASSTEESAGRPTAR
jgi:Domain of unknown function (DUF4129)